jgi:hypothetical protein
VSKIKLIRGGSIKVPVTLNTDFDITGQEDLLNQFEEEVLQDIINPIKDYEVVRYKHKPDEYGNDDLYFVMSFINSENSWIDEYSACGFTEPELFNFSSAVQNSFFKLDFYDSPNREVQKLQFSKILPMYLSNKTMYDRDKDNVIDYVDNDVFGDDMGGEVTTEDISKLTDRFGVDTTYGLVGSYIIPNYYSNSMFNTEISNVLFFKDEAIKDITEFYVSCRFFNAKNGDIIRMINDPKSDGGINPKEDFYLKMVINKENRTYEYFDYNITVGERIGHVINKPILFFQML